MRWAALTVTRADPTIEDTYRRNLDVQGRTVLLELLDTAGQEDFSPLRDQWIRESEGFLLVYSVTSRASLEYLEHILRHIRRTKEEDEPDIAQRIVVAGNKIDLAERREVTAAEAREWGRVHGVAMAEFSAKTRAGLNETFQQLLVRVGDHKGLWADAGAKKPKSKAAAACAVL